MFGKKKKENNNDEMGLDFFSDFSKLENVSGKRERKVNRRVSISKNREKLIVTFIEIVIVVYFILAVLGFVPFF